MIFNFILPFYTPVAGGGIKIMYEYANRFAELGNEVRIYHSLNTPYFNYPLSRPFIIRKLISLIKYHNKPVCSWFKFNKNVQLLFLDNIEDKNIADADATISTWWSLVEPLSKLEVTKGVKLNLIQGYEDWDGNVDLLHNSYKIKNVKHIVVSPYLKEKVSFFNKENFYIPNSIDQSVFYSVKDFLLREELSFCMCYSAATLKGFNYGLEMFINLRKILPNLKLTVFGTKIRPDCLPEWVLYYQNPSDLRLIYSSCR